MDIKVKKYFDGLTGVQKGNINRIIARCKDRGITNEFTIAAILSVVSKESEFIPKSELSYSNTDNARLRKLFGKYLVRYNDTALTQLKQNDVAFYDTIYGGRGGNTSVGDGYRYRGRGLNQITFKNAYRQAKLWTGVDVVSKPERLNEFNVAVDALIGFYKDSFKKAQFLYLYNTNDINGFTNLNDAVRCCYHINAGLGRSAEWVAQREVLHKKCLPRSERFYKIVTTGQYE